MAGKWLLGAVNLPQATRQLIDLISARLRPLYPRFFLLLFSDTVL